MNTKIFIESIITIGIGVYLFRDLVGKVDHKDPKKVERREKIMSSTYGPWFYFFCGSFFVVGGLFLMFFSFFYN